jgi:hypothetical protein
MTYEYCKIYNTYSNIKEHKLYIHQWIIVTDPRAVLKIEPIAFPVWRCSLETDSENSSDASTFNTKLEHNISVIIPIWTSLTAFASSQRIYSSLT